VAAAAHRTLQALHPAIELRCITTDTDPDLARERIDLAITLGTGEFPQHQRWHFVDEEIYPVCSPAYLRGSGRCATCRP
jgi:LysR family glycine cleavage system transcriptional activator